MERVSLEPVHRWCRLCSRGVEMVTPEEMAALMGVSPRQIYRQIEEGRVHFVEEPDTVLLVCQTSFFSVFGQSS